MDIIQFSEDFKKVFAVDCFEKEFESLFSPSDYKRYANWLQRNLRNLDNYGKKAVDGYRIEKLEIKKYDIYSIRYPRSKSNPRVLFFFATEGNDIILLAALLEKSPSDYNMSVQVAKRRMRILCMEDY